ncbi:MAG: hypothetical protein ABIK07_10290 [Planctomycetota bacterium]
MLPLSVIAVLLALTFFGVAAVFQSRGLTDDTLAAVAATLIGGILLIAGIAGIAGIQSRHRKGDTETKKTVISRIPNGVIRVIALLLGSSAVPGGIDFLCMSFIVLNQEYLRYFEFSRSYHSGHGSQAGLLAEFAIMGFGLTGIGVFLLWYAVHPLSRFKVLVQKIIHGRRQTTTADPHDIERNCKPDESS